VTISSGLSLFVGITILLDAKRHTSSRTTFVGVDHSTALTWWSSFSKATPSVATGTRPKSSTLRRY
jgi:hypothetical protein